MPSTRRCRIFRRPSSPPRRRARTPKSGAFSAASSLYSSAFGRRSQKRESRRPRPPARRSSRPRVRAERSLRRPRKLKLFDGSDAGRTADPDPAVPVRVSRFDVPAGKWDYFFGRVKAKIVDGMSRTDIQKQRRHADARRRSREYWPRTGSWTPRPAAPASCGCSTKPRRRRPVRAVATPRASRSSSPPSSPPPRSSVSFYYSQNADGKADFGFAGVTVHPRSSPRSIETSGRIIRPLPSRSRGRAARGNPAPDRRQAQPLLAAVERKVVETGPGTEHPQGRPGDLLRQVRNPFRRPLSREPQPSVPSRRLAGSSTKSSSSPATWCIGAITTR